ncbi:MAG: hypothetical protein IJ554_04995, partial [Paludibacteraceae bacterium]|nr:hypothetical protein [Paludibacteraceae bacterium]
SAIICHIFVKIFTKKLFFSKNVCVYQLFLLLLRSQKTSAGAVDKLKSAAKVLQKIQICKLKR